MATSRRYYSTRTGKNPAGSNLDLPMFLRLFRDMYMRYFKDCYFQEAFGYVCVDDGEVPGTLGLDMGAQLLRRLRKPDLWPVEASCMNYSEDDLFDVIELLYDHVSKPTQGRFHSYGGCGWHYYEFDQPIGREEYRSEINEFLHDYMDGYELSTAGEILTLPEEGLEDLLQVPLPSHDPENVESRVANAIQKYRRSRSSTEDKRDAIRDLADVLEFLRSKAKTVLTAKDEADLFNLANNFGIRHHNDAQKTDYDKGIWYNWMFYYFLAAIHASSRLIKKHEENEANRQD